MTHLIDTGIKITELTFSHFTHPEDDMIEMFITQTHAIMISYTNQEEHDAAYYNSLPTLVKLTGIKECVFINSAWAVERSASNPQLHIQPKDDPNRRELVNIIHITKDSLRAARAYIIRFPDKPPILTEWEHSASDPTETLLIDSDSQFYRVAEAIKANG